METTSIVLIATAISLGFIHTLAGPDHYLPFIFLSKAGNWKLSKTLIFTAVCGLGHVLSSIILGFIGLIAGIAITKIEIFDGYRADIASILFLIFGFIYLAISLWKALRKKLDLQAEKAVYSSTPWIIFIIFFLGPCEPLIPILMYPAAQSNWLLLSIVTVTFSVITIMTMIFIVFLGYRGISLVSSRFLSKYGHVMAGCVIFLSGIGMVFFDL